MSGGGCNQRQPARMPPTSAPHIPVLLSEVVTAMAPAKGDIYLDGTFGAGGYTRAVLDAADCSVLALDRDPQALADGSALANAFDGRLTLLEGCYGDMEALAHEAGFDGLDGVMLDLGVSSMQLDTPARGFSFMRDGPLDMRMGATGPSAEDLVNDAEPSLLASILSVYGEERRARAIARAIVGRRETGRITRTGELSEIICSVLGQPRGKGAHPATRTFQALRIYLNDELGELLRGLHAAERLLRPGGRLVVVTFHSLEDRMVKRFLANRSGRAGRPSRHMPEQAGPISSFEELPKRTQKAGEDEISRNSRARSARLRGAVRTRAPAFPADETLLPNGAPRSEQAPALGGRP